VLLVCGGGGKVGDWPWAVDEMLWIGDAIWRCNVWVLGISVLRCYLFIGLFCWVSHVGVAVLAGWVFALMRAGRLAADGADNE
jgi:membrane glycosyltransferase